MLTVLYELLVKARVLPSDCSAAKLKPILFRCQALFVRFIEAAMKKADEVRFVCFKCCRLCSALLFNVLWICPYDIC